MALYCGDVETEHVRRPLPVVVMLVAVIVGSVAVLGLGSRSVAPDAWCAHVVCADDGSALPAPRDDAPPHHLCVHDLACGGGAALVLGLLGMAVLVVRAAPIPPPTGVLRRWSAASDPVLSALVDGVERPPRFAR